MMEFKGTFRLHFNRFGADPLVWSIKTPEWELNVAHIKGCGVFCSMYQPKPVADDEDGKASAWFEMTGHLRVVGNTAYIWGNE